MTTFGGFESTNSLGRTTAAKLWVPGIKEEDQPRRYERRWWIAIDNLIEGDPFCIYQKVPIHFKWD